MIIMRRIPRLPCEASGSSAGAGSNHVSIDFSEEEEKQRDHGFVSFRFKGFDAGRPLVRDTPFWGIRSNVQFNGCTHWADWSIRQEGSTPVVLVRKTQSFRPENYRLIGLESGSFLLRHYKITQRWAKVFLKALVERNSVMVEVFYMILISQKYDQKRTILKG